eukprot:scaffold2893_cov254-Pinguiococcus_pyrenoidosus.AAC.20
MDLSPASLQACCPLSVFSPLRSGIHSPSRCKLDQCECASTPAVAVAVAVDRQPSVLALGALDYVRACLEEYPAGDSALRARPTQHSCTNPSADDATARQSPCFCKRPRRRSRRRGKEKGLWTAAVSAEQRWNRSWRASDCKRTLWREFRRCQGLSAVSILVGQLSNLAAYSAISSGPCRGLYGRIRASIQFGSAPERFFQFCVLQGRRQQEQPDPVANSEILWSPLQVLEISNSANSRTQNYCS